MRGYGQHHTFALDDSFRWEFAPDRIFYNTRQSHSWIEQAVSPTVDVAFDTLDSIWTFTNTSVSLSMTCT